MMNSQKKQTLIWLAVILFVTLLVYSPGFKAEFTNFDDNRYVTENPMVWSLSGENITNIFSTYYDGHYHPLTMLSMAIDYSIVGMKPWLFHAENIFFHLINTLLVFFFIRKLWGKFDVAVIASFLFGIHTFHVESVVWIAERKDVLFAFFFLLSLISYLEFLKKNSWKYLVLSLLLFVLSCLSKGQAVALAPTILAIDYLKDRKLLSKNVILEKIPFFAIALFFGIIAMQAHETFPYLGKTEVPLFDRIIYACYGFILYIGKLILPLNLSAYYPYPSGSPGTVDYIFPILAIAFVFIIFWQFRKNKPLVFSMLFFFFNIVLLLKVFQVHLQTGKFVIADRYSYVSSIGFFFLVGYLYEKYTAKYHSKKILLTAILSLWILVMSVMTFNRSLVWNDSITLWNNVVDQYPELSWAYGKRGLAKAARNDVKGAIEDYTLAIKYDPDDPHAYNNRGNIYASRLGDLELAMKDLNKAIEVGPKFFEAYSNRGLVRFYQNDLKGAMEDLNFAIEVMPTYAVSWFNRGHVFSASGKFDLAISDYNEALNLNPRLKQVYLYRGIAYNKTGNFRKGLDDLNKTLEENPKNILALQNRAETFAGLKDLNRCIEDLNKVLSIDPRNVKSYFDRGNVLYWKGAIPAAIKDYLKVTELNPENSDAWYNLAVAYKDTGNKEEACRCIKIAEEKGAKINREVFNLKCE